ncbi:MAG: MFS transporter [Moorea sp. SIO4A3]|nr:MFS transporter [Moorena sp. SIO4A3]
MNQFISQFTRHRDFACVTVADLVARSAYQMGKTPLLPIFAATLGATGAFLGLIVSVSTVTGMVLKPLIGILSDRWGRRVWLLLGTAFFAVMPFLYQFIQTPKQLLAIRLMHGIATAIYGPVTVAFVAEQTHRRRAERLGWFSMARSGGYILGPAIAGALLLVMEPVQVFTIIGLLSSVVFIPVLLLPEVVPSRKKHRPSFLHQIQESLKAGGRTPAVWLSGGLNATMFIALYAIKAFLPVQALELGMNVALVGLFFSVQEGVHMILRPWGGHLGDYRGYLTAIALGMALLGITLSLLALPQTGLTLLSLAGLMGVAQALVFPSSVALVVTQISPQYLGAGIGLVGTLDNFGKVIGPVLGGLLIQRFEFGQSIQMLGFMVLLAAALVWTWKQRSKRVKNFRGDGD